MSNRKIAITASLYLCISSFLCTALYIPFFMNGLRDYSLYCEWRTGAVVQCAICAILMAVSIAGGTVALLALRSAVRNADNEISLGSFFCMSAGKTILTFLFVLYLELDGRVEGSFKVLLTTTIVFLIILLPDVLMSVMCFTLRKKPDSKLFSLVFAPLIIPAITVCTAVVYFVPSVLFYISDYGMRAFLTMLVEDGWIIAVPIVALIFYTMGLILIGLLMDRKKTASV